MPSNAVGTRPFATDSPLKWFHDVIWSPLDQSSFPGLAIQGIEHGVRRLRYAARGACQGRPGSGHRCVVLAAAEAEHDAVGDHRRIRHITAEIQAGTSCTFPPGLRP